MNYLFLVKQFHKLFKHPVLDKPTIPQDRVTLRINLLREELNELEEACKNNDIVEVADAFCDLQYVLSGAILEFGMADIFPQMFEETHNSNLSKTCKSLSEAQETVNYWTDQGQPAFFSQVGSRYLVYRKSDEKTLKSINYTPSNLKQFLS